MLSAVSLPPQLPLSAIPGNHPFMTVSNHSFFAGLSLGWQLPCLQQWQQWQYGRRQDFIGTYHPTPSLPNIRPLASTSCDFCSHHRPGDFPNLTTHEKHPHIRRHQSTLKHRRVQEQSGDSRRNFSNIHARNRLYNALARTPTQERKRFSVGGSFTAPDKSLQNT
jgi:hypothetical protein